MKKILLLPCVFFSMQMMAQNHVQVDFKDATSQKYPLSVVDTLKDDQTSHKMILSVSAQENAYTFPQSIQESAVVLNGLDKPQSFNCLQKVSFLVQDNPTLLKEDRTFRVSNSSTITMVVPYVSTLSAMKVRLQTTGSFVYVNGSKYNETDSYDFSNGAKIQVVAFNGDVRTYQLKVVVSSLPIVSLEGADITDEWSEQQLTMQSESSSFSNQLVEVKGKGSHFKQGLKNSYSLKFEDKISLSGMSAAKRWVLLSAQHDPSLLRTTVGFDLARQFFSFAWTPSSQPVELLLNGSYQGTYFITEQIRVCKGRVEDGLVFSAEQEEKTDDDAFVTSLSKTRFVMTDPETGVSGTQLVRTKQKVDAFESLLWSGSIVPTSVADMKSIADWFVFSEWMKNADMLVSDDYWTIDADGKLTMGPIWDQSQTFGSSDKFDVEGWVSETNPFVAKLLNNNEFRQYVTSRLTSLSTQTEQISQLIQQRANEILLSATANEMVWQSLGATQCDVESVTPYMEQHQQQMIDWLLGRLQWMTQNF